MYLVTYFNELTDSETALLTVGQVKGSAKDALEVVRSRTLWSHVDWRTVWQILDQAQMQLAGERFDEAYHKWETTTRRHGQSVNAYTIR